MLREMISHEATGTSLAFMQPISIRVLQRAGFVTVIIMAAILLGWWCYVSAISLSAVARYHASHEDAALTSPLPATVPTAVTVPTEQAATTIQASTEQTNGATSAQVTVNGAPVAVPASGTVHKVVQDKNGSTTLDISLSNPSSSDTSTSSHTQTQVNTSSDIQITSDSSP